MGIIINSTEENKILITGTTIQVPSVYGRLEFAGRADGKTLEIAVSTYASKEAFKSGASVLSTNVPMGGLTVEIKPTEVQGLITAHEYGKIAFENEGYNTVIDLN